MLYAMLARRWYLSGVLLLVACGAESPPNKQTEPTQAEAPPSQPAPASAAAAQVASPQAQASQLAEKAEQALREERLFAPAGNNAFEWFLQAHELDPENVFARDALLDLVPYAVLHIEQRITARDLAEAQRLVPLLQRAQPDAPALPRLQNALARLPAEERVVADAPRPAVAATPRPAAAAAPASNPAQAAIMPPPTNDVPQPSEPSDNEKTPSPLAEPSPSPASAPITRSVPLAQIVVPEPISRAAPRYPVLAERRKIEGSVELEFIIQTDGSVANVRVLRSQPEGIFDRDAVAAMQRWRYPPVPAAIKARRSFDFKLGKS